MRTLLPLALLLCLTSCAATPQVVDLSARTDVAKPTFARGAGPRVAIDQGHNNFHTVEGRYAPFANLLRSDGYRLSGLDRLAGETLRDVDILVISNPLHQRNVEDWSLPNPSAFTAEEIALIKQYVESGGALLLNLDHMPFPGAGADLAKAFGFDVLNGFALPRTGSPRGRWTAFTRKNGGLIEHPILRSASPRERVDGQISFSGTAFTAPPGARPILRFTKEHAHHVLLPDVAWEFSPQTRRVDATGLLQGATLEFGKGRIAVFGEAAMFSAQTGADGKEMGFHAPQAAQNRQFLLNLMRWLSADDPPA